MYANSKSPEIEHSWLHGCLVFLNLLLFNHFVSLSVFSRAVPCVHDAVYTMVSLVCRLLVNAPTLSPMTMMVMLLLLLCDYIDSRADKLSCLLTKYRRKATRAVRGM